MLEIFKNGGSDNKQPPTARRKISIKLSDVTLDGYLTEDFECFFGMDLLENEFITIETTYNNKQYLTTIRTSWVEYITEEKGD
jgi:hypothetical protein